MQTAGVGIRILTQSTLVIKSSLKFKTVSILTINGETEIKSDTKIGKEKSDVILVTCNLPPLTFGNGKDYLNGITINAKGTAYIFLSK